MLNFNKHDAYGQVLKPGDVCVRSTRSRLEFCVYKGESRGNNSKGTFGRFITDSGITSLKFTSVIFVFDGTSSEGRRSKEAIPLIRRYYEDIR